VDKITQRSWDKYLAKTGSSENYGDKRKRFPSNYMMMTNFNNPAGHDKTLKF
jgi:hypothetical protein